MVIYDQKDIFTLFDFGIQIPVSESRATKTFAQLKSHRILGEKIRDWHIARVEAEITKTDLLRVHSKAYVEKLFSDELENEIIRAYELLDSKGRYYRYNPAKAILPLNQLLEKIISKVSGTFHCCQVALEKGFCFYFGGGMHHAQREYGNGFCLLNDILIAIRKLQAENAISNAWVIDVDVHKGDGTAAITDGDESVVTLSVHMAQGWPLDGEKFDDRGRLNLSFIESDIDIPIATGEEHLYVAKLEEGLGKLDMLPAPDIAIVVSGADPYEKDELPSTKALNLTLEQLKERDLLVYNFLKSKDIPRAYLMAGGYGESSWEVYAQFLEWALLDNLL
ncbi:MAG: histone deacetylase [Deltaproteobacteria bacterium]|nr:MAG: histone deacetylase [Deltaproteobacteria bacterium]